MPPPLNHCAVCGIDEDTHMQNAGWPLTPVTVAVNRQEEGASYVTRWYCEDHMDDLSQTLLEYGLGSHHHGSTTMVEADPDVCGGYGECTLYEEADGMEEVYRGGPLHPEA
jgi:hypothetical protein